VASNTGKLTVQALRDLVASGTIDTVLVAITDMQGRLQGKRCGARYFLEEVLAHGTEGCNYLLAVDVDMNTVDGYEMSSWERGYGDLLMAPDLDTLRLLPWLPGTALVICDVQWLDKTPMPASPRQILKAQLDRLAERGLKAFVGTELEFIVFNDTFESAWNKTYKDLEPANQYNVDYSMLGTARIEPLLRDIRNSMEGAGLYVESAKGECNLGQQEIAFRYDEALATCDNHSIYKNGAKEIASLHGKSLTFMAKYNEREGNSCHIHLSFRSTDGSAVLAGDREHGFSELMERFVAGQLACLPEFTYLLAALIASGLHGIENELEMEPMLEGNAYNSDKPHVPTTLREASALFGGSKIAREAFGDEMVDHYINAARVELDAYDAAVTDWERVRGFERL